MVARFQILKDPAFTKIPSESGLSDQLIGSLGHGTISF